MYALVETGKQRPLSARCDDVEKDLAMSSLLVPSLYWTVGVLYIVVGSLMYYIHQFPPK